MLQLLNVALQQDSLIKIFVLIFIQSFSIKHSAHELYLFSMKYMCSKIMRQFEQLEPDIVMEYNKSLPAVPMAK